MVGCWLAGLEIDQKLTEVAFGIGPHTERRDPRIRSHPMWCEREMAPRIVVLTIDVTTGDLARRRLDPFDALAAVADRSGDEPVACRRSPDIVIDDPPPW